MLSTQTEGMRPLACWKVPNSISVSAVGVDRAEKSIYFGCSDGSLFHSSLVGSKELHRIHLEKDSTGIVELEVVDSFLVVQSRNGWIEVRKKNEILGTFLESCSLTFCTFKVTVHHLLVYPSDGNCVTIVDLEQLHCKWEIPLGNEGEIGMITCLQPAGEDLVFAATDAGFIVEISLLHKKVESTRKEFNGSSKCCLFLFLFIFL